MIGRLAGNHLPAPASASWAAVLITTEYGQWAAIILDATLAAIGARVDRRRPARSASDRFQHSIRATIRPRKLYVDSVKTWTGDV